MTKRITCVIITCIFVTMCFTFFYRERNMMSRNILKLKAKHRPLQANSMASASKPVSFEHKTYVTERTGQPDIKVTHRVLSQKNIIFVVAYMRSGSTMTASFLEANPGTFYRFEPLRGVYNKFKETKANKTTQLKYSKGSRTFKKTKMANVMMKELQAWLTCNLTSLSMETILDRGYTLHERDSCIKDKRTYRNKTSIQSRQDQIKQCVRNLVKDCVKSPSIVLKFIRLSVQDAAYFLPSFPNMKIIHLVRDPRGIISSRDRVGFHYTKNGSIANLCKDIQSNLFWTKKVFQQYNNRIKIVHYEDIAENPYQLVQEIYSFVGYNYSKDTEHFVTSVTDSAKSSCPFCIKRKNSTETASVWRHTIPEDLAETIYHHCKHSMDVLGYLPLENKFQLRNTNIASRITQNTSKRILQSDLTMPPLEESWLHQTL